MIRPPPRSPLFPYTTLFRSSAGATQQVSGHRLGRAHRDFPCMLAKETLDGVRLKSFFGEHARKVAVSSTKSMTDRKSTRLNSSHGYISYAVFCLKKKIHNISSGLPFPDASFDYVFMVEVLEHTPTAYSTAGRVHSGLRHRRQVIDYLPHAF